MVKDRPDSQVEHGAYDSSSECTRELIRQDDARRKLRSAIIDGIDSPTHGVVNSDYLNELRTLATGWCHARKQVV